MSHIAVVEDVLIPADDAGLADLEAACLELGCMLVRGQQSYKWYGRWVNDYHGEKAAVSQGYDPKSFGKCEHAIQVPGATYEIGVVRRLDGQGFTLLYDNWQGGMGIESTCGVGATKLLDEYLAATTTRVYKAKGYSVAKVKNADGSIDLDIKESVKSKLRVTM